MDADGIRRRDDENPMKPPSTCTCGLLEWHARNARGAVTREAGGGYALRLTPRRSVRIAACWFCGGYERDDRGFTRGGEACRCGALAAWAADMFLPVLFDRQMK